MIEGIPFWLISLIVGSQGTVGIVMLFWFIDQKRTDKIIKEKDAKIDKVLESYRSDMLEIRRMYESNVRLVEDYEGVCRRLEKREADHTDMIRMNTQASQRLIDYLENRTPCWQRIKEG